jgi:hypothetical protein
MSDELARAVVAIPVALFLALLGPLRTNRPARAGAAALLVAAALAVHYEEWQTWAIVAVIAVAASIPADPSLDRPLPLVALAVAALGLAIGIIDPDAAWGALSDVAESRDVVYVVAGGLATVFLGGVLIGWVLRPFAERVREGDTVGMQNAGRYIGWLERSLLYGLVLVGSADAAALVIAAKSIARFPSFSEEKFAEYYLIGTLMSLLLAAASGVAVRAAMGLEPLG